MRGRPEVESRSATIPASALASISTAAACRKVDLLLGTPDEQPSPLLRQRFQSEFQSDWKAEVGQWLATAEELGFLEPLWDRVVGRVHGARNDASKVDANESHHRMLWSELAPAMLVHYLRHLGWNFADWEPARTEAGRSVDVDVALFAPDGTPVDFQVKAPDRIGYRRNRRIVDGEDDNAVTAALDKAAKQLPRSGPQAKIIALNAQRTLPLMAKPRCVVSHVLGSGYNPGDGGPCLLTEERIGHFGCPEWKHIGAVILVDLVRRPVAPDYGCFVIINPWADVPVDHRWFKHGRLCYVEDGVVRWVGGQPEERSLPNGTRVVVSREQPAAASTRSKIPCDRGV